MAVRQEWRPSRLPRITYPLRRRVQALDEFNRVTVTVTESTFEGSYLQPWRGDTQVVVPSGYREKDLQVLFTTEQLRPAMEDSNDFADRVVWNGVEYEVVDSQPWGAILIHYQVTLVRVPD